MSNDIDVRIVLDDNATLVGAASFDFEGNVTLENPAFLIPNEQGGVNFIPALMAMGIDESETEIFITKDKLKFGKSFLADPQIANAYKQTMGYSVHDLPETKQLIL